MPAMKAHDHILVHLVEPQEIGYRFKRSRNQWPLHITLAKWFSVPDVRALAAGVERALKAVGPFDAVVGAEANFGPADDTPVNIMADQRQLTELHMLLVSLIRQQDGHEFMNEVWMGADFRAHITHHQNARRHTGDVVSVQDVHLVRMADEQQCEVVQRFQLGKPDSRA